MLAHCLPANENQQKHLLHHKILWNPISTMLSSNVQQRSKEKKTVLVGQTQLTSAGLWCLCCRGRTSSVWRSKAIASSLVMEEIFLCKKPGQSSKKVVTSWYGKLHNTCRLSETQNVLYKIAAFQEGAFAHYLFRIHT